MREDLDIEQPQALREYLVRSEHVAPDEPLSIHILAGGVSNRTVLVERPSGEAWVLKQALPKLRVPVDWFSDPRRIEREVLGLRWLSRLAPAGSITPLVFEDPRHHLLAMQAVPQPHENWKTQLLSGRLDPNCVAQFGQLIGTIHCRAYRDRDLLQPVFADRSYFESLRIEPYYAYTASQVPQARSFLHRLIEETRANPLTLVHGDYSPKNILVHQGALVLLDHEVIHFGDPAFDIGFSLTHLLSKAHYLSRLRAAFADAALHYWRAYLERAGDVARSAGLEERAVRHTLGCLLARVAGRSVLEYFGLEHRTRQREIVLSLMASAPPTVSELVRRFISGLSSHVNH
jgi:tRNA A-37 threonylcarbamoyl transferase component Bud32